MWFRWPPCRHFVHQIYFSSIPAFISSRSKLFRVPSLFRSFPDKWFSLVLLFETDTSIGVRHIEQIGSLFEHFGQKSI